MGCVPRGRVPATAPAFLKTTTGACLVVHTALGFQQQEEKTIVRARWLNVLALVAVPACAFAVDGQMLINQSTVISSGNFPYRIKQPGSYKLSGNLNAGGAEGISIEADNVTLDLNGFTISGGPGPGSSLATGITSSSRNVVVKNGVVAGFGTALNLTGSGQVSDIETWGVGAATVNGYVVVRCSFQGGFDGLTATASTISDSRVSSFGNAGMNVTDSVVVNSVITGNFMGIAASNSTVIHNVINNNHLGINALSTLFGGNTILNNSQGDIVPASSFSQGNNLCSKGPC